MFVANSFAQAQACGYTFLTIHLTDSQGNAVKNAQIKTFDKEFKSEDPLHYPNPEASDELLGKNIAWSEKKQAYFGAEGLCGGHRNVGLRISAEGFEKFDKIIDFPLGWTSLAVRLKRNDTADVAEAVKLAHFYGQVLDKNQTVVPMAELAITAQKRKQYFVKANENGRFETDIPIGNYTIDVSKYGFDILRVINFEIEDSSAIYLDLTLNLRTCDDCSDEILKARKEKKELILDYRTIKRKNNKP